MGRRVHLPRPRRFMRGVPVNDETLALEVIRAGAQGRQYLTNPHTLRHCPDRAVAPPGCSTGPATTNGGPPGPGTCGRRPGKGPWPFWSRNRPGLWTRSWPKGSSRWWRISGPDPATWPGRPACGHGSNRPRGFARGGLCSTALVIGRRPMSFGPLDFQVSTRVLYGPGLARQSVSALLLPSLELKRVLIVTDPGVMGAGLIKGPRRTLEQDGMEVRVFHQVAGEPTAALIDQVAGVVREIRSPGGDRPGRGLVHGRSQTGRRGRRKRTNLPGLHRLHHGPAPPQPGPGNDSHHLREPGPR